MNLKYFYKKHSLVLKIKKGKTIGVTPVKIVRERRIYMKDKKFKITQERKQEKGVLNKSINRDKKSRQKWEKYVKIKGFDTLIKIESLVLTGNDFRTLRP